MDVKLPRLGEGSESGVVVGILVKEGQVVTKGQTILELENEKAVAPIPAPVAGTVAKIRVKEGDRVAVGQVVLSLLAAGETAAASTPPPTPTPAPASTPGATTAEPAPSATDSSASADASAEPAKSIHPPAAAPSIRLLARQLGIDLTKVRGSESGGRIVLADLRAYIQRLEKLATAGKSATTAAPPAAAAAPAPAPVVESIDFSKWGPVTKKPLSQLRKVIGHRMTENWNTIPHVTQFDNADITALLDLRKQHAAAYSAKGAHLTLTGFAIKAVVAALKQHPTFNASLDTATGEVVLKDYFHIGIAVDTDGGLLVPVIRDADKKSLFELSKELQDLATRARERKVALEEMKGGTFTISNQGGIGGAHFTPIVNKPEVAILGLGRGAWQAVVREKKIEPRMLLPLGISYDHRLIDGGTAARFTVDLVRAFETFTEADVGL